MREGLFEKGKNKKCKKGRRRKHKTKKSEVGIEYRYIGGLVQR